MTLSGKNVAILGGTGLAGSGAAAEFLSAGANVAVTTRDAAKAAELKAKLAAAAGDDALSRLKIVEAAFDSDDAAAKAADAVTAALGTRPDHVVAALGFIHIPAAAATGSKVPELRAALEDGFEPHFRAAAALLPRMKDGADASYTIVSGGAAHGNPMAPILWAGAIKNGALNALGLSLASEHEGTPARVNVACVHFGIAPFGGGQNQLGFPGVDTAKLGGFLAALAANGKKRGELFHLDAEEDLAKEIAHLKA
ncbi:hypothetical protein DFJ74DRAFT_718563 [Hyaloraphidium curvatum]|nr:hypothetical protein DFJ74DRAFT_718563 [Hyaloraphidium curvatum]